MRIYFDTEFTQFRDGQLLSVGFVADDDQFFYVEIDEPGRKKAASEFCHQHVLSQFGLCTNAAVATDAAAGQRVTDWLLSFGKRLTLSYDYKLDWYFLEAVVRAAGSWGTIQPLIEAHDIASDASQESALAAQESYFQGRGRPGRHHALVDAYALRERWREYQRLLSSSSAA